jgi:3-methylfumaryl-CoA hydratase
MTGMEGLKDWIGRCVERADVVTDRLCDSFVALFGPALAPSAPDEAPLGLHWCLAPAIEPSAALGPDGHAAKGNFLPPIPLPRRMWAGVETRFLRPLRRGDPVVRRSRIVAISQKQGRSGPLCFVTVEETIGTAAGTAVVDRVLLVYRAAATPAAPDRPGTRSEPAAPAEPVSRWPDGLDAVALFRYSALTFNAHRIHFDRDYARNVEAYPDLLVHGPLQATLLLNALARHRPPHTFSARALVPLFAGESFGLYPATGSDWVRLLKERGGVTMEARAE